MIVVAPILKLSLDSQDLTVHVLMTKNKNDIVYNYLQLFYKNEMQALETIFSYFYESTPSENLLK